MSFSTSTPSVQVGYNPVGAPNVEAPTVQAPTVQVPTIQAPAVNTPTVQADGSTRVVNADGSVSVTTTQVVAPSAKKHNEVSEGFSNGFKKMGQWFTKTSHDLGSNKKHAEVYSGDATQHHGGFLDVRIGHVEDVMDDSDSAGYEPGLEGHYNGEILRCGVQRRNKDLLWVNTTMKFKVPMENAPTEFKLYFVNQRTGKKMCMATLDVSNSIKNEGDQHHLPTAELFRQQGDRWIQSGQVELKIMRTSAGPGQKAVVNSPNTSVQATAAAGPPVQRA